MKLSQQEQQTAAKEFAQTWKDRGDEKSETQQFWLSLLQAVFGVTETAKFIEFEKRVQLAHVSFIDAFIADTKVLIEQKSADVDLHKSYKQSDGTFLTPFGQAKRYASELPYSLRPRWVVVCNFRSFLVYDMEKPNSEPFEILLKDLEKEFYRLSFLTKTENVHLQKEMEVSKKAGKLIGLIYDELYPLYEKAMTTANRANMLHSLNMLCVRLVFCLYAEDAGVFGSKQMFGDYISRFEPRDIRRALLDLFKTLDQKPDERDAFLSDELAAFPYVNGGLFSVEDSNIPQFTLELKDLLCQRASEDFDWSEISPTIFGAIFESTLNPETRRSGGMHYTSIENIHKVIDPLFLDGLQAEYKQIADLKNEKKRNDQLLEFQKKLGTLKFLDPACGSGNFLTETFVSLRRLENECLKSRFIKNGQVALDVFDNSIFVTIQQFYGIELNDFAATVATTALWIAESQMLEETSKILGRNLEFLPLKNYANIVVGNALRMDWREVLRDEGKGTRDESFACQSAVETSTKNCHPEPMHSVQISGSIQRGKEMPKQVRHSQVRRDTSATPSVEVTDNAETAEHAPLSHSTVETSTTHNLEPTTYIMGNPPFVGYSLQSKEQKDDMLSIFVDEKGKPQKAAGKIDYVSAWYRKASELIQDTNIKCAFVSTNSITQGEQVSFVWKDLFERFGVRFDFAYRTFKWDSESTDKAAVHCVIIGFSCERYEGNTCHFDRAQASGEIYKRKRIDLSTTATPSVEVTGNAETAEHAPLSHSKADVTSSAVEKSMHKIIFDENGTPHEAKNINPYLIDADNVWIEERKTPICPNVSIMNKGSQGTDDGHFYFTQDEYDSLCRKYKDIDKFLKETKNGQTFLSNEKRYCLWCADLNPSELRKYPELMDRIQKVREFRLASPKTGTKKWADYPYWFTEDRQPRSGEYLLLPLTSSEKRKYVPIGYLPCDVIANNSVQMIPNATKYDFGILNSTVFMAWMRAVCGRLKSDYRITVTNVYNNFPWCEPTDKQKEKIEQTAQAILDARAKYPDSSLGEMYSNLLLYPELNKAHQANDKAVISAYGWQKDITESEIVAKLMQMYMEMVNGK